MASKSSGVVFPSEIYAEYSIDGKQGLGVLNSKGSVLSVLISSYLDQGTESNRRRLTSSLLSIINVILT